jgi:hypothetical protein
MAVLTCKVALMGNHMVLLFLAASGIGQLVAPVYFSLDICAVGMFVFCGIAMVTYPFTAFLTNLCYIAIGFFGRGFFSCSLIYLNEIGGDRFRSWSLIVIFAIWGVSSLLSAFEEIIHIPRWIWYYVLIFLPAMVFIKQFLKFWKPSPVHLFKRSKY